MWQAASNESTGSLADVMQLANSEIRYGLVPQIVHWLTFICVAGGWLLGWFLGDFPKDAVRSVGLLTHITLGQCVLALLVVRLAWRFANPPPAAEKTKFGKLVERAGKLSHFALYALLFAVPFVGIVMELKRGGSLPIFGFWEVTSPWPVNRNMARNILRVHEYLANTLVALAGLHAAAALTHHYVWRDRTLVRMLPGAS
jgi:cytochrome b561